MSIPAFGFTRAESTPFQQTHGRIGLDEDRSEETGERTILTSQSPQMRHNIIPPLFKKVKIRSLLRSTADLHFVFLGTKCRRAQDEQFKTATLKNEQISISMAIVDAD